MTDLSKEEKEELAKILTKMEEKIKETRPKCTNSTQIDILDEIEAKLNELKK